MAAGDGFWPRLPTVTRTELGLIVHGGGWNLADSAAIAEFLKAGGHLLCLGLDEEEANAFLPFKVGMTKAEHIASFFEPPPASSLLSGVAPADVHNRDPQKLPLVSAGATILGDGVLAQAEKAHVVFYQFPPYTVTSAEGEVPSFLVDGHDAVEGKQSALVTMGMTAGGGTQFGQSVKVAPQVGKTYTFAACLKGVGGPVLAHLGGGASRVALGPGRQGRQRNGPGERVDRPARHLQVPDAISRKAGKPTSAAPRKEHATGPICSGCTKGTTCRGRPPRRERGQGSRRARKTCLSTPASRAGRSPGSSCSMNSST